MVFRIRNKKKDAQKTISNYRREMLIRLGREQFKKLLEKGISIPVALL